MYLIEVNGDIIIRGGQQWAMEWVCYGENGPRSQNDICHLVDRYSPQDFNIATHYIDGNLVLSKTRRAVPYAIYVAHGDIIVDSTADDAFDGCGIGYRSSLAYWEESLASIMNRLSYPLDSVLKTTVLNSLFIECFGSFELLLCDLVLSFVYSDEGCHNKAVDYCKQNTSTVMDDLTVEIKVHEAIANKVYHRFEQVRTLFHQILEVELPDTSNIQSFVHKRNNIVHRRSLSALDFMTSTNASVHDVEALIDTIKIFVEELKKRIEAKYNS